MKIDCYVTLGTERETVYRADELVRDLDSAGVDMALAAPADREITVFNRSGNTFIQAGANKFPDRIIPACTVNPWYGAEGVEEMVRAFEHGAKMLVLNPTIQGFLINDELVNPLINKAQEFGMPVYVHTGPHLYGAPWQLVDCAMRFPEVIFIMGHAGATDYWNDVPYSGKFASNVYIEGSFARPFTYKSHVLAVGVEKAIMGSSAPRNNLVFEWEQYSAELDGEEYRGIFGDNLARILHLEGGRE